MVYELYADSLFLINFVMNLYLLMLVNRKLMRTATRVRLILGAGVGAAVYVLSFCVGIPAWIKWPAGIFAGVGLMLEIAFRPGTFRSFLKLFGQLCQYSFLIGGMFLAAGSVIPFIRHYTMQISGVLGTGALCFLVLGFCQERAAARRRNPVCRVRLKNKDTYVSASALWDSGNSLREPISGKPVCIIDKEIFQTLWGGEEQPFRAIPYHSIGKENGILQGYLLPALEVESEGEWRSFCDVYVAVSRECKAGVILNPYLLEERSMQ